MQCKENSEIPKKYRLTKYEKETTIVYNEAERMAQVYSCIKKDIDRLEGLCKEYPNDCRKIRFDDFSTECLIPKKLIQISKPRTYSEQERKKRAKRLASIRKSSK